MIFIGGLICIFDLSFSSTFNGSGWKFDLFNDFVGMVMVTWGVFKLAEFAVGDHYNKAMRFVKIVVVLICIDELHNHFVYQPPSMVVFLDVLLAIAGLVAYIVFCKSMQWLCACAELNRSEKSWKVTMWLFIIIYAFPLGLFYVYSLFALITENYFHFNLGAAVVVLIPVFCVPVVHLFVSTVRMKTNLRLSNYQTRFSRFLPPCFAINLAPQIYL